jgi:hypothetical protein
MAYEETSKLGVLHYSARVELDATLTEPLPERWKYLLQQLRERERRLSSRSDEIHQKKKSRA